MELGGPAAAHSGVNGLALNANDAYAAAYQDIQGLIPGNTYQVTVWNAAAAANSNAITELVMHDTTGGGWVTSSFPASTSWQPITLNFIADSTAAMRIAFIQSGGATPTYWDDVSVTPLPPNPGFENDSLSPWLTDTSGGGTVSLGGAAAAVAGSHGLILNPSGGYAAAYQDLSGFTPGTTVHFFIWLKTAGPGAATCELVTHDTTGNGWTTVTGLRSHSNLAAIQRPIHSANLTVKMRIAVIQTAGQVQTYWDEAAISH